MAVRCVKVVVPLVGLLLMSFAPLSAAEADSPPQGTIKVAAIQCSSDLGSVDANRQKLAGLVRQAAAKGAKIVVLPETAITGYVSQDLRVNWHLPGRPIEPAFRGRDPLPFAETVPGASTEQFCALAKELKIYLTIPLVERVGDLPPALSLGKDEPPVALGG